MFSCSFDIIALYTAKDGRKVVVLEIDGKKKAVIFDGLAACEISTTIDYVEVTSMGFGEKESIPISQQTSFSFIGIGGVEIEEDDVMEDCNPAGLLETVELFKIINKRYINEEYNDNGSSV